MIFPNSRVLLKHVRDDHDMTGKCSWKGCNFRTKSTTIRNHLKKHLDIIEAVCEICKVPKTFKWRFDLKKHLSKFHLDTVYVIGEQTIDQFQVQTAHKPYDIPPSIANILL